MSASSCCRREQHDLPSHKSESGKSPTVRKQCCLRAFVRAGAAGQRGFRLLEPVRSLLHPAAVRAIRNWGTESCGWAFVRAGAAMRRRFSYGSELSAGAAFVLAGFSSGTGVCARGGTGARRTAELGRGDERIRLSGSGAVFCRWFMSAFAVLPRRFPRRMLVLAVLSRRLSSVYPCLCGAVEAISSARVWLCGSIGASCLRFTPAFEVLLRCLSSVHACCLPHGDKQDGLRYLAFLFRRVEIAFVRSRNVGAVICLGGFTSGLAVSLWRSRRVTGDAGTGDGAGGAALVRFARSHWL